MSTKAIEPEPDKILTRVDKEDREVWADDSIVIYMDPELDYFDYQQFVFNSAGVKWDGYANRPEHFRFSSFE